MGSDPMSTMSTDRAERRPHPHLVVSDLGPVRVLRIDREDKLGALSSGLVGALGEQIASVSSSGTRCLILTGTGRGFIAGADIQEYSGATTEEFTDYQVRSRAVFDALSDLALPTIAAVNGYAFGGGFELALCCDLILATERATFALPEVKLGLIPGGGGTQRLARTAGSRFAGEAIMTGRTIGCTEAERRGIVSEIVPAESLVDRAVEIGLQLADRAPIALQAIKRLTRSAPDVELSDGLTAEQNALTAVFATTDAAEGIAAFIEKRPAHFIGH